MKKISMNLIVFTLGLLSTLSFLWCDPGRKLPDNTEEQALNISGSCNFYQTYEGQAEKRKPPEYVEISQAGLGTKISKLDFMCYGESIGGTLSGTNISLSGLATNWRLTGSGTIDGDVMSGTFQNTVTLATGIWRAEKTVPQPCNRYEVFGAEYATCGIDNYSPEESGAVFLGYANSTQTFKGSHKYYLILTRYKNVTYVDAVQGSNGIYFGTESTGNVTNHLLINALDGVSTAVGTGSIGGPGPSGGGFIVIDASGASLSSITVHVTQQ